MLALPCGRPPLHRRYHGRVIGDEAGGGFASLSACELPLKIHATVFAADHSGSFELQPLEDGGHVAYYLSDLKDKSPTSCGVNHAEIPDEHDDGSGHTKQPQPDEHHWAFQGNGTSRVRRQSCAKTVLHTTVLVQCPAQ